MKSQGQARLEIYQYINKLLEREITEKEHDKIKELLFQYRDVERDKEATAHLNKMKSLEDKIKSLKKKPKFDKPKKQKPDTIRVWKPKQ